MMGYQPYVPLEEEPLASTMAMSVMLCGPVA
jgi:hypothetical protein